MKSEGMQIAIKCLTNVLIKKMNVQTKRMIKFKKENIMIPEEAPSAEENTKWELGKSF